MRELEKKLGAAEKAMDQRVAKGDALVKEEVDSELIAEIVGQWTGIPVARLEVIPWAEQCVKCKARGERRR